MVQSDNNIHLMKYYYFADLTFDPPGRMTLDMTAGKKLRCKM